MRRALNNTLPAALLVLLPASARAGSISSHLVGTRRNDLSAGVNLGHEIDLSPGRATEREGSFPLVARDRKIPLSQNVHANESIDIPVEGNLGDPHHGKHDSIREGNID